MNNKKEDIGEKVSKFTKELIEKIRDCKSNGHRKAIWFPYIVTSRSNYKDKVNGMCLYCFGFIQRPLNDKEIYKIKSFYESLNDPFTI